MIGLMRQLLIALGYGTVLAVLSAHEISASPDGVVGSDPSADDAPKPVAVLAFAGIGTGMSVMDIVPHDGFYTQAFAMRVGPSGHVYDLVPAEADAYLKKLYPNGPPLLDPTHSWVSNVHAPIAALSAPLPLDVAFEANSYHDLHTAFFGPADIVRVDRSIYQALKPGGVFIVLDHAAALGAGSRDAASLHRIERDLVVHEVEAAGFKFEAESAIFHVGADSHQSVAPDADGFGSVDMFLLRFRK